MRSALCLSILFCAAQAAAQAGDPCRTGDAGNPSRAPAVVAGASVVPGLPEAEARLALCNRDIQVARRALQGAEGDLRAAGQAPNPTLQVGVGNVNPALGVGAGGYTAKAVDTSLRLEQLIERGEKRERRTSAAEHALAASRADVREVERQQLLALYAAWFDVAGLGGRVRLLQDVAALHAGSLDAARRREAAGDIAPADVSRLALDAQRAQADLRQAQADLRRARVALAQLLALDRGADIPEPALPAGSGVDEVGSAAPGELSALLDLRPDVQALRARERAALAARDLARSLATRDLTLGVQYDHWPANGPNAQGTGNTYSVSLSVPLHLRHAYEGERMRAEADYYAALDALRRGELAALADLERTSIDFEAARERSGMLRAQLLPQAERVAQAAEFSYAKGASGVLELLDARRALRQVQLDLLAARIDAAKAEAAWRLALRTSYPGETP